MRAEIAFGCGIVVGINVQCIVRTSLHASLATDAAPVVEINYAVCPPVQCTGGTNFRAWRIVAVIASHHSEVARRIGKLTLFDMLDPSAKYTNRHLMFFLARDRTSVTTNTPVLIDDKSISHLLGSLSCRMAGKDFSFDIIADPCPQ
jgi:hypothetical protein